MSDSISDTKNVASGSDGKRKRKDYKREFAHLHAKFVKLKPGFPIPPSSDIIN